MHIKPIHPFAARMAPEIAFHALSSLAKGSTILDPMSGSGTVLRMVSERGYKGIGFDIDPLSVLHSRAWNTATNSKYFNQYSAELAKRAINTDSARIHLPWIDEDEETKNFIKFWFGIKQRNALRKLSYILSEETGQYSDLARIALSRIIITKGPGASLGIDVSHSRPHKVMATNPFEVNSSFIKSCHQIGRIQSDASYTGEVKVYRGDARKLNRIDDKSISAIITSPPYLNAIDYMRGHKLSLVWLGHSISDLSLIRSNSIGSERAPDRNFDKAILKEALRGLNGLSVLEPKNINIISRYAIDSIELLRQSARVLEKNGKAVFVVGNSSLKGVYIENSRIIRNAAELVGLSLVESKWRRIPENKRYLPPPNKRNGKKLKKRMKTEFVMTFVKAN